MALYATYIYICCTVTLLYKVLIYLGMGLVRDLDLTTFTLFPGLTLVVHMSVQDVLVSLLVLVMVMPELLIINLVKEPLQSVCYFLWQHNTLTWSL